MNVYLLGAGASKSYEISKVNESMPLANEFFSTFNRLDISSNGWVLVGGIINYVRDERGISISGFSSFNEDIEQLHTEIQERYLMAIEEDDFEKILKYGRAHTQLVFLFCSVINEIQNGGESEFHKNFVLSLCGDDVIITFNWDTLVDKSLRYNTSWLPGDGYFVKPSMIYRNGWIKNEERGGGNLLLKLHGSTNWISSYITYDHQSKKIDFQHAGSDNLLYVYESTNDPYACYDGRYMAGYEDYTMGYYPPNIPLKEYRNEIPKDRLGIKFVPRSGVNVKGEASSDGIVSMPVIIPPVKNKSYDFYGDLFPSLWERAEEALVEAEKIYVLGYSFPITDYSSSDLFKRSFLRRDTIPDVVIVNPEPDQIAHKFKFDFGIPEHKLKVYKEYITNSYIVPK